MSLGLLRHWKREMYINTHLKEIWGLWYGISQIVSGFSKSMARWGPLQFGSPFELRSTCWPIVPFLGIQFRIFEKSTNDRVWWAAFYWPNAESSKVDPLLFTYVSSISTSSQRYQARYHANVVSVLLKTVMKREANDFSFLTKNECFARMKSSTHLLVNYFRLFGELLISQSVPKSCDANEGGGRERKKKRATPKFVRVREKGHPRCRGTPSRCSVCRRRFPLRGINPDGTEWGIFTTWKERCRGRGRKRERRRGTKKRAMGVKHPRQF